MRIAYIGIKGLPSKGGAERVVEAIVERLKYKHDITVYCSKRYTPPGVKVSGVRLLRIPTLSGKHLHMFSLDLLAAFHALIFGKYDIIHLHNMETSFIIPLLRIRFKVITTAHGCTYTVEKWNKIVRAVLHLTEYLYLFFSNAATSVSQQYAEKCMQKYKQDVYYIPNGVDCITQVDSDGKIAKILKSIGVVNDKYIIFAAGRIIPLKGCHILIEAFRNLTSNYQLLIVGDLTQIPHYGRLLSKAAKGDSRIHFLPFIESKEKLFGLIQGARLFVFPSLNEGMSMLLLEVAALGVPLVCSDIIENTSVLGDNALYFRSGNVESLTDKLKWALIHFSQMKKIAVNARSWVLNRYSWKVISRYYEELYNKLR